MRGIATHTQVSSRNTITLKMYYFTTSILFVDDRAKKDNPLLQAMSAHSSVAVGLKGASKAMSAMNKVTYCFINLFQENMNDFSIKFDSIPYRKLKKEIDIKLAWLKFNTRNKF